MEQAQRTLFADETVVSVVGIVGVSGYCASSVAYDAEVELCAIRVSMHGSYVNIFASCAVRTYRGIHGRIDLNGRSCGVPVC